MERMAVAMRLGAHNSPADFRLEQSPLLHGCQDDTGEVGTTLRAELDAQPEVGSFDAQLLREGVCYLGQGAQRPCNSALRVGARSLPAGFLAV